MTGQTKEGFREHCILELYGHQQIAGEVTEQEIAGSAFVRVDVPATNGQSAFTRFYGTSAIYSITPVSEEVARLAAERLTKRPVTVYIPEIEQRQLTFGEDEQQYEDW